MADFDDYMRDVSDYLSKVKAGRTTRAIDPRDPRFSQEAHDQRLARQGHVPAGYGTPAQPTPQPSFNPQGFGQAFVTQGGQSPSYGFGGQGAVSNRYESSDPRDKIATNDKLADVIAKMSPPTVPPGIQQEIYGSNAQYDQARAPVNEVRWSNDNLNAYGYTKNSGPLQGRVVVTYGSPSTRKEAVNTLSHELFHQKRALGNMDSVQTNPTGTIFRENPYSSLEKRMNQVQPPDASGPYFGLKHSSGPEEQLANIAGYEGSLPAGVAITDTPVGKTLFEGRQDLKDHYFHYASQPYGGWWNGQSGLTGRKRGN